jgi:hypothetical protein
MVGTYMQDRLILYEKQPTFPPDRVLAKLYRVASAILPRIKVRLLPMAIFK